MSLTLSSTTESAENLQHGVSEDWRTPPSKSEEPAAGAGETPLDKLPPKKFNEVREQQIRDNKDAARNALNGEENGQLYRKKGGGGVDKRIDSLTKARRQAETRAEAAEREVAELRARLNGAGPAPEQTSASPATEATPRETPTTPEPNATEQNPRKIEYEKKFAEASARYADFKETLEAADRSGIKISDRLDSAIRATGNVGDVAYFLAKNPKLISELEKDPSKVAQISRDLQNVPDRLARQEATRRQELLNSHAERLRKAVDSSRLQKLHNDAVASGIDVTPAVRDAVLEQTNSEQVLLHLLEHHDLRAELRKLSPAVAISRVGRLAEQLEAKAQKPKVAPPPPIEPITSGSSRGNVDLFSKDVRAMAVRRTICLQPR